MNEQNGAPRPYVLPKGGFVRLKQIQQLLPIAKSTIYDMVERGDFPRPFRPSARVSMWRADEVRAWMDAQGTKGDRVVTPDEIARDAVLVSQSAAAAKEPEATATRRGRASSPRQAVSATA